jgi:integrase
MSVHQKTDGRYFTVHRDEYGKRRETYFGRGPAGKKAAQQHDLEIKLAKTRGESTAAPSDSMYIDELSQAYVNHCKVGGRSRDYLEDVANMTNKYFTPFLGARPVDKLTYHADIAKFAEHLANTPGRHNRLRSPTTINRYFEYLRAILKFGIAHGMIKNNPLSAWKKAKEQPRRMRLTVSDLSRIMQHAAPHLKWAIEVEFNLGVRPGKTELFALKWSDVDFERGVVTVYASKTKTFREIPLRPEFLEKLRKRKAQRNTEYLIEYRGGPLLKITKSLKTAAKAAGIEYNVRMYDIRHLFATAMLSGGADLSAVSKLMGHARVTMTADVYYQYLKGEKERAVNLLPSLSNVGQNVGQA